MECDQGTFDYYGLLNKLVLDIGSHNEQHEFHEILWTRLPELKTMGPEFYDTLHCQQSWVALTATFVFDPSYSLGTRLENVTQVAECATRPRSEHMTQDLGPQTDEALDASPRLFESDLLDKLSRVHHLTPLIINTPIIVGLLFYSLMLNGVAFMLFGLVIGYLAWTLTEYFSHRYLFHTIFPLPFGLGPRLQFLIHGVHHIYPNDPLRLVMPPLLSVPSMLIALTIIRLLFGASFAWPVLAGFMVGYGIYDWVHYWTHYGQPKSDFAKQVKRLHMLHHFRDAEKGFGVHAIWWDYVFGTAAYQEGDTPGSKAV